MTEKGLNEKASASSKCLRYNIPGYLMREKEVLRTYAPEYIEWLRDQLGPGKPLEVYQTPRVVWEIRQKDGACE